MEEIHRIFVGGLFNSITKDELRNRFQTFGNVTDVTIVHKRDGEGNISKTFGYVNIATSIQKLNKCFAVYGGTKWKGHELKVQLAKEDFMARLQKERNEPDVIKKKKKKKSSGPTKTYNDILETTSTMKKIVPGTPVEGERNWVVGKYGRPLPIVHIPKVGGKKTVKVDPSKYCHCLKRITGMDVDEVGINKLTWTYDDTEIKMKSDIGTENAASLNADINLKTDKSIKCSEKINNGDNQLKILSVQKKKKLRETKENIHGTNSSLSHFDAEPANSTCCKESNNGQEENHIESIKKHKKKKKMENRECTEGVSTISTDIIDNSGSILFSCETKTLNDELDLEPLNKCGKKGQKREMKETLQHLRGDLRSVGDNTTKDLNCIEQLTHTICSKPNENSDCPQKEEKTKDKEIVSLETTTADTVTICNVLDNSLNKRKRKQAKDVEKSTKQGENKHASSESIVTIDTSAKKPKHSNESEDTCLPDICCEDIETVTNHKNNGNRLSTSIVEQLLAVSKNSPFPNEGFVTAHKNPSEDTKLGVSIVQQLTAPKNTSDFLLSKNGLEDNIIDPDNIYMDSDNKIESNDEESDEMENLFDFKFEDIGNNCKKSFLDTLMGSIEVRENMEEFDESSGVESSTEEDHTNCSESVVASDIKGFETCIKSVDVAQCKGGKGDDETHGHVEDIALTVNSVKSKVDKSNMKQLDSDKHIKNSVLESTNVDGKIKRAKILNSNKQEKHALSEEKRKKSLEARNSQILHNKCLVTKALKDVDKSNISANRIVFSDNDSEEDALSCVTVEGDKDSLWSDTDGDKLPDIKACEMGGAKLFEDSDEEELQEDEEFKLKPQFQGKEGEKLFKLQQRFGGDERFKLDERFAANDIDEEENMNSEGSIAGDLDETDDIQKEKEMNISILEQVLGKSVGSDKKEREYIHQRYDPENVEHEKFEVKSKATEINAEGDDIIKKQKAPPVVKLPEVSKDTFYSVNESIKDLFGKGESVSFSFLGNDSPVSQPSEVDCQNDSSEIVEEDQSEEVVEKSREIDSAGKLKVQSWKKGLEDMNQPINEISEEENRTNRNEKTFDDGGTTYLFFPEGDVRLDIGKRFIRTDEVEEITNQWRAIRRTLTEDYKKKHKDAVRRVRKARERRFNKP